MKKIIMVCNRIAKIALIFCLSLFVGMHLVFLSIPFENTFSDLLYSIGEGIFFPALILFFITLIFNKIENAGSTNTLGDYLMINTKSILDKIFILLVALSLMIILPVMAVSFLW